MNLMLFTTRILHIGPRRIPAAIPMAAKAMRFPANPAKVHHVVAYGWDIADEG